MHGSKHSLVVGAGNANAQHATRTCGIALPTAMSGVCGPTTTALIATFSRHTSLSHFGASLCSHATIHIFNYSVNSGD